jgi:UDP-N-acetyl-D-glucosamine dehydrogenase
VRRRPGIPRRLAIIGQGYEDPALSMLAAQVGHNFTGVNLGANRVEKLRKYDSYVDDVSGGQLRTALDSGRFTPANDYPVAADFDIAVITAPTPLRDPHRTRPSLPAISEAFLNI